MSKSLVQQALEDMKREGISAHAAAMRYQISASAVYRAQKQEGRQVCECCGQVIVARNVRKK